ncbi:MAG: PAS domain-containing protein [Candidatus Cryosericum sp.]|jgi:PAS domain S-box-containing protein
MSPGEESTDDLWRELWRHDPNALVVVDEELHVLIVNPSFCAMFMVNPAVAIGMDIEAILGDAVDFRQAFLTGEAVEGQTRRFPAYGRTVREVCFPVKERHVAAAIFHDITQEERQSEELKKIREESAQRVNAVVEDQMRVVQEVSGLLGETLAKTRVSLYQLIKAIEKED